MADEASGMPGPEGSVPEDAKGGEARSRYGITRRQMLTGGAATSLAAVLAGYPDGPARLLTALARDVGGIPIKKAPPQVYTFAVEREADLVLLDITFHGFLLNSGGGAVTSLVPASSSNVIVVQFPPQAIGEAVYEYAEDGEEPPWYVDPPPVMSAVSGPSRLCFTLNGGQQVDFPTMTAADLLDWSSWTLLVPAVAQVYEGGVEVDGGSSHVVGVPFDRSDARSAARSPAARPASTPKKPSELLTAIEYPYALFLAPAVDVGGALFGFTTRFSGRKEPLFGEYTAGGGGLGVHLTRPDKGDYAVHGHYPSLPPATQISDCWTAALEVSTYDQLPHEIGLHGFEYQPPPPRKPEVAAIWTRDYEHKPEGATPQESIDYTPYEISVRRGARVLATGGKSAPGASADGTAASSDSVRAVRARALRKDKKRRKRRAGRRR
jgi:hypothetical protein